MAKNNYNYLTQENLLENIRKYYEEHGKSPLSKEIKNPTVVVYFRVFNNKTWNEILDLAGIPRNHTNNHSDEFLLQKLEEYLEEANIEGVPLTIKYIDSKNRIPCGKVYYDRFGGIQKALEIIGKTKIYSVEEKIENSKNFIIEFGMKNGRYPLVEEYDNEYKKYNGISRRSFEIKIGLKYNNICRQLIPNCAPNMTHNEYNGNDILKDIKKCIDYYSPIVPIYREYLNWSHYNYTYDTITKYCGKTYLEIIKEFGLQPRGTTTRERSKDDMIADFIKLYTELGRIPTYDEINSCQYCACAPTYTDLFGSIEGTCIACDIEYIANENNGFGYKVKDKNGEYCKSFGEMVITNYFIDNNIQYEKEYNYNKIENFDIKDKRKLDWKIIYNNKTFYIEYFGCYTNTKNSNMYNTYVKKANKKVKDFEDVGLIKQCIFIYPEDFRNNDLDKIFNKYLKTG